MAHTHRIAAPLLTAAGVLLLGSSAAAQSYSVNTTDIPTGGTANSSYTENIDFADVDGDGDWDAIFADGGDCCNDRNRLWINQGGAQGGTNGVFVDRTNAQLPSGSDDSRDVEFSDIDNDGDLDVYVSNTSAINNQTNRWWINQGGDQAGTEGFYVDETQARWVGLGQNNGTTQCSSIAASQLLILGGFIDFSCDCDFGDIDNDGDQDLVHSSYGGVFGGNTPTRLFLNDGAGFFEEFNPSCHQLTGQNIGTGEPGLWCEGTELNDTSNSTGAQCDIATSALDIDVGDDDGDFDLDILHGARDEDTRIFRNRLEETGTLIYRDVTGAVFPANHSPGGGHYEQEWGDFDNDNDLDIYGLNWNGSSGFTDVTLRNSGGSYTDLTNLSGSVQDDNEGDFVDYDNNGVMDLVVGNFSGNSKLYRTTIGGGAGFSLANVTSSELPTIPPITLDVEACDVDDDGDYDIWFAKDIGAANQYAENITGVADTTAARLVVSNIGSSGQDGVSVRAAVYDNAPYYITWYNTVTLEYDDGSGFVSAPMLASGGQIFRGVIPTGVCGQVSYRVRSVDRYGNTAVSSTFVADIPDIQNYCTAGTTTNGCTPSMTATGTPSVAASSGFTVSATGVEGQKNGILFYGLNGPAALSWGSGSSFLCVKAPTQRTGSQASGGTVGACDGTMSIDFLAEIATHPGWQGVPFSPGDQVWFQGWFRDPPAAKTTNLTDGLTFCMVP